ncbi:MAG: caspase family protein [Myxococcota bacterium]
MPRRLRRRARGGGGRREPADARRGALRYAHRDAADVAAALTDVGGFAPDAVHVLLDPAPDALLDTLRQAVAEAGELVVFYYSGHADRDALYPGGHPVALDRIREVLDDPGLRLRVGIVDACGGGSWTGTKGLSPDPAPFALPPAVDSEGAAWIASTSGSERALEADVVGGSLFTHHLVAGLRGAADRSGDGEVTLSEAFAYARRLTARDAAVLADTPQTPSFHLELRGRRDLVLAEVASAPTEVRVVQRTGPLQVVHVDSGAVLTELEPGPREVRLALPAGDYVVRRATSAGVLSADLSLAAGDAAVVDEAALTLHAPAQLARKGAAGLAPLLAAGQADVRLSAAIPLDVPFFADVVPSAGWAPTDRVQVTLPGAVAVRLGRDGGVAWVPWAGATRWLFWGDQETGPGGTALHSWTTVFGTGGDAIVPVSPAVALQLGTVVEATWTVAWGDAVRVADSPAGPHFYRVSVQAALSVAAGAFTVNLPLSLQWRGALLTPRALRGGRPLPLVQWHATRAVSVDLFAGDTSVNWPSVLRRPLRLGTTVTF